MNDAIKQRLVGAAVLLILAGLLWPILFNFDDSMRGEPLQLEIPDAPEPQLADRVTPPPSKTDKRVEKGSVLPSLQVDSPASSTVIDEQNEQAFSATVAVQNNVSSLPQPDDDRPKLDAQGIPVSYIVQVATFSQWGNAVKFRDHLIVGRLKAYIKPGTSSQIGPYQVAIGPVLTYKEAETISLKLQQDYDIRDSIIRRFRGNS